MAHIGGYQPNKKYEHVGITGLSPLFSVLSDEPANWTLVVGNPLPAEMETFFETLVECV